LTFRDCLQDGYIRKDDAATKRVENSLKLAKKFLRAAEKNIEIQENIMGEIAAYNSIFHSLRALLFFRGYREKSHYCLMVAVEELFPELLGDRMKSIHRVRMRRHQVQYDGIEVPAEEVQMVIGLAREILDKARNFLQDS